jgi:hypothetical protein
MNVHFEDSTTPEDNGFEVFNDPEPYETANGKPIVSRSPLGK